MKGLPPPKRSVPFCFPTLGVWILYHGRGESAKYSVKAGSEHRITNSARRGFSTLLSPSRYSADST
jgi:hypothetical protein